MTFARFCHMHLFFVLEILVLLCNKKIKVCRGEKYTLVNLSKFNLFLLVTIG